MPEVETLQTADGSMTARHLETGATYRSVFGALDEVRHVFIESTRLDVAEGSWCVVELGFGLGTSFAETCRLARERSVSLRYISVERDPVAPELAQHPDEECRALSVELLRQLQNAPQARLRASSILVELHRAEWLELDLEEDSADAIYFDPFGPSANPESWTDPNFEKAHRLLKPTGRLATYSAAGHVRRAMARSDLYLATRPGPGRKREITVASPTDAGLGGLDRLRMSRYRKEEADV